MTKRILALLLAVVMVFTLAACRGNEPTTTSAAATESTTSGTTSGSKTGGETGKYKIGIITGTVSQGEEEFQAAEEMKARYGDMIVTATYPDNFSSEVETVINQVQMLASDPEVKAIVFVQAVGGAAAAIDKVRETRPDMLFVLGVMAEDPEVIAKKGDVLMLVDELSMGDAIPREAKRMGATRLIHYSFPRHLGYTTIAARRQKMIEVCQEIGIEFIDATAPDPTGDAGMSGAQQFIVDDLPKKLAEYGKDTAFFSTNCGLQEPLIRGIAELGMIYPQQCCPSPYHAYPAALNIDVSGHEGDVKFMLWSIQQKLNEKNQAARMSTWGVPMNMLMVEAGVRYAQEWIEGKITERNDPVAVRRIINEVSAERGAGEIQIGNWEITDADGKVVSTLDNYYLLLAPFVDFTKEIDYNPEG